MTSAAIPQQYQPRLLTAVEREGYWDWSLPFFTDDRLLQVPYLDMTLQWNATHAYGHYQRDKIPGGSFFSFLIWHWMQGLKSHWGFRLRYVSGDWYVLDNPPVMVSVAIGGKERFAEMLLQDATLQSYEDFQKQYAKTLQAIRNGEGQRADYETFCLSCVFGNLPALQFTGLTLHYRREAIQGQPWFYFGKRYEMQGQLLMPLCIKLHHANTDPYGLNQLIQDIDQRFIT